MIDLLYVAHNRLEYTRASFAALIENTDWGLVDRLVVLDDASTDGTAEWLRADIPDFYARTGQRCDYQTQRFGGPVAAMNYALDRTDGNVLAKIDNDFVVCPGWLNVMLDVLDSDRGLDALGMEPGFAAPLADLRDAHGHVPARWIGGIGLIRTRVFGQQRPKMNQRFFGWTEFQRRHVRAGWVSPDLPCFSLDRIPVEPWRSLAAQYLARGWSRSWPVYGEDRAAYWSWWTGDREPVA